MALPVINQTPKFEMEIPSTKEVVKFRPYLVKEEKIMMMAVESEDQNAAVAAVVDTIDACVEGGVDRSALTTFDVEYMFTQIRTRSVGENAKVKLKCQAIDCDHENDVQIELDSIKVKFPEEEVANEIKISDDLSMVMKYPKYTQIVDSGVMANKSPTQQTFDMIAQCIEAVNTADESILFKDESHEDQMNFIESLTKDQLEQVQQYVEAMPKMVHDFKFECDKCKHSNEVHLEGMQNFF